MIWEQAASENDRKEPDWVRTCSSSSFPLGGVLPSFGSKEQLSTFLTKNAKKQLVEKLF